MRRPRLIVTSGEPAGIGPDICLALIAQRLDADLVIACDAQVLSQRGQQLGIATNLPQYDAKNTASIQLLHVPTASAVQPGELNSQNARYVLAMLDRAIDGCVAREFDGIV